MGITQRKNLKLKFLEMIWWNKGQEFGVEGLEGMGWGKAGEGDRAGAGGEWGGEGRQPLRLPQKSSLLPPHVSVRLCQNAPMPRKCHLLPSVFSPHLLLYLKPPPASPCQSIFSIAFRNAKHCTPGSLQ